VAHGLRHLTADEVALARPIFGERIDYGRVRISEGYGLNHIAAVALGQPGNDAITMRRTIYFSRHLAADFSEAPIEGQALLAHEMTHIMQWAELGIARFIARYLRELAAAGGVQKRMYDYEPGQPFARAGIEAQAQMVQDYFIRRALRKRLDLHAASLAGTGLFGL
jgi:hypothetical protein